MKDNRRMTKYTVYDGWLSAETNSVRVSVRLSSEQQINLIEARGDRLAVDYYISAMGWLCFRLSSGHRVPVVKLTEGQMEAMLGMVAGAVD